MQLRGRSAAQWISTAIFIALALCLALAPSDASAMGVIGIDYGTQFLKVSLVKPGLPFDVVLGRDSKRKIAAAVGWKPPPVSRPKTAHERLVGSDAASLATRQPQDTFTALKLLLGQDFSSEVGKEAQARVKPMHGATVFDKTSRNTIALVRSDANSTTYSVEELVGMQISHAKGLAEEVAGEKVSFALPGGLGGYGGLDVVITVPAFFTAAERQSLYDAASLSHIRPRFVTDGTAVAVNYAMTRSFPEPEYHLFYDAGSGSSRATVVEFSTQNIKAESIVSIGTAQKSAIVIRSLGAGWDREAGGLQLDLLLRDILVNKFEQQVVSKGSKLTTPIRDNHRAMTRLLSEANRVKHILSANAFASTGVESLADEIDFRSKVDREEFEAAVTAAGWDKRFVNPVQSALQDAKLKLSDLTSVVLVGGSSRVPFVQQALRSHAGIPDDKILTNVNADEAAVMGAAFYGGSFNPQFRMKDIRARDYNAYEVVLRESSTEHAAKTLEAPGREEVILYPHGPFGEQVGDSSASGDATAITRHYVGLTNDTSFALAYSFAARQRIGRAPGGEGDASDVLYNVDIEGISSALKDLIAENNLAKVDTSVNVTLSSRPLGLYAVDSASLLVKPKPGGIAGALRSFFGGSTVKKNVTEPTDDGKNDTFKATKKEDDEPVKDKFVRLYPSVTSPETSSVRPVVGSELKASKDRLYQADRTAERSAAREDALNSLESFVYSLRETVGAKDGDGQSESFFKASTKEERQTLRGKIDEVAKFLSSAEADEAETKAFSSRKDDLKKRVDRVEARIRETGARERTWSKFKKEVEETTTWLAEARANLTASLANGEASKYVATELDTIANNLEKDRKWFDEAVAKQKKRASSEDAVLLNADVDKRRNKIRDARKKIEKRRIPKSRPPKKEKKAEEKNTTTSEGPKKAEKAEEPPKEAKKEKPVITHEEL